MNSKLLRAAMIACLPFCAMAVTVAAIPAVAADQSAKSDEPKMSKPVLKLIVDANKAAEAKDYKTVIEKCQEAAKVSDLTDADRYYIDRYFAVAYYNLNDKENARTHFVAVAKNPATPESVRKTVVGAAMQLSEEVNDNATVIEIGKIAIADKTDNPDIVGMLAASYYQTNDFANALTYAKQAIDMANSQNKIPSYATYQILAFSYDKQKDRPNEIKAFSMMARDYGKPDDWKYLIDFSIGLLPAGNKQAREIAALDIYRLGLVVGANWTASEYLEAEDAAHSIKSWGDARQALEAGMSKGVVDRSKYAALLKLVTTNGKKDEPILAAVEKSTKGKDYVNVGEAYYGYGRYADAVRVATKAVAEGGPTVGEAKILLAIAQTRLGNEAAATQALANFQGDPALGSAAELWNVYLTRKYGKPEAAPAAPAAH